MNGPQRQLIGDRAESKVQDHLLDSGFSCHKLDPDPGEDFLVEIDGRAAISKGDTPKRALIQVKGHEPADIAPLETEIRRRVDLSKFRRWTVQALPVYIVAVALIESKPVFYAASVDEILDVLTPTGDVGSLTQESLTLVLRRRDDLASYLRQSIQESLHRTAPIMAGLQDDEVRRNHYEVLERRTSDVPPTAKVFMRHYVVHWKSPWRPAHFWAMLNHLIDRVSVEDGRQRLPLFATIHVYRSLDDRRHNRAIANVSWLEEDRSDSDALRALINWPKAADWLRFRIQQKGGLLDLEDIPVKRITDGDFLEQTERLYKGLDELASRVLESCTRKISLSTELVESLSHTHRQLDDEWERIGFPNAQYAILEKLIVKYLSALDGAIRFSTCKDGLPEERRLRWLFQELSLVQGCMLAYWPIRGILEGK